MSSSHQKPDKMISRSRSWLILGLCPLTPDASDRQIWGFVDFTWWSLRSGANWVGEQNQRNPQSAKIRPQWISVESEVSSHFQLFHSQIKVRMDQTIVIKSPSGHRSYWPKTGCIPWSTMVDSKWLISLFLIINHNGCWWKLLCAGFCGKVADQDFLWRVVLLTSHTAIWE